MTELQAGKTTRRVRVADSETGAQLDGYEIHHGATVAGRDGDPDADRTGRPARLALRQRARELRARAARAPVVSRRAARPCRHRAGRRPRRASTRASPRSPRACVRRSTGRASARSRPEHACKSRVRGRGARSERERIPARRSGWNPFKSRDRSANRRPATVLSEDAMASRAPPPPPTTTSAPDWQTAGDSRPPNAPPLLKPVLTGASLTRGLGSAANLVPGVARPSWRSRHRIPPSPRRCASSARPGTSSRTHVVRLDPGLRARAGRASAVGVHAARSQPGAQLRRWAATRMVFASPCREGVPPFVREGGVRRDCDLRRLLPLHQARPGLRRRSTPRAASSSEAQRPAARLRRHLDMQLARCYE